MSGDSNEVKGRKGREDAKACNHPNLIEKRMAVVKRDRTNEEYPKKEGETPTSPESTHRDSLTPLAVPALNSRIRRNSSVEGTPLTLLK
jgi:hypothetical protein